MRVAATVLAATLFVYADATTPVLQPLGMGSHWQHLSRAKCALSVCALCLPTLGAITILPGMTVCVGVYTYPSYTIRKPTYGIDAEKGKKGYSKWRGTTRSKICNYRNICNHLSVWCMCNILCLARSLTHSSSPRTSWRCPPDAKEVNVVCW